MADNTIDRSRDSLANLATEVQLTNWMGILMKIEHSECYFQCNMLLDAGLTNFSCGHFYSMYRSHRADIID